MWVECRPRAGKETIFQHLFLKFLISSALIKLSEKQAFETCDYIPRVPKHCRAELALTWFCYTLVGLEWCSIYLHFDAFPFGFLHAGFH